MNNPKHLLLLPLVILFISGCHEAGKAPANVQAEPAPAFIHPPLPGADVPLKQYSVIAEKGDTIFYPSGSIILFPPGAFVDKAGNIVDGNITVKYREFFDPLDFYLAGIPMNYDSAHTTYNFVSSGMCEIRAFKNSVPVFVNPANKPEIYLARTGKVSAGGLYYLDTAQEKWVNKGSPAIENLQYASGRKLSSAASAVQKDSVLVAPVMPSRPSGQKPQIVINVAPGSFAELMAYNNLKFELQDADKSWNPKDADEEWSDIRLERTDKEGLYSVMFSNAKRKVTYSARPVLEGKDYDAAVKTFELRQAQYRKMLNNRLEKEELDSVRLAAIKKIDALIEARNRYIEERNKEILAQNKQIAELNKATSVLNQFQVDGFGIWNCDIPIQMKTLELIAHFADDTGKAINLSTIAVVCKSVNGILEFNGTTIRIFPDVDNMIWGVSDGKFAYLPYDDFRRLHITSETKEQTFFMQILPEKSNYETIKSIVGKL